MMTVARAGRTGGQSIIYDDDDDDDDDKGGGRETGRAVFQLEDVLLMASSRPTE